MTKHEQPLPLTYHFQSKHIVIRKRPPLTWPHHSSLRCHRRWTWCSCIFCVTMLSKCWYITWKAKTAELMRWGCRALTQSLTCFSRSNTVSAMFSSFHLFLFLLSNIKALNKVTRCWGGNWPSSTSLSTSSASVKVLIFLSLERPVVLCLANCVIHSNCWLNGLSSSGLGFGLFPK